MRPYVTVTARFLVATPDRLPRLAWRGATGTAGIHPAGIDTGRWKTQL